MRGTMAKLHVELVGQGNPGDQITIVHGGAFGADYLARECALDYLGWREEIHNPDWNAHGKAAGPIRNEEMAKAGADLCLAFWDGKSRGTLDMITRAVKHGIPVRIVPRGT